MEKVFDAHIHHLFKIPLEEAVQTLKEEFAVTQTEPGCFLSIPHEADGDKLTLDKLQNIKMLYLKHSFAGSFAFAGLVHPEGMDDEALSEEFLRQAKEYLANGYDGIKMLEGYPGVRKIMKRPLCSPVYDKFFAYLEENNVPITMHVANPEDYWDIANAPAFAIQAGRVCDETYPTKAQLEEEVQGIMKKFPKLRMALAHFGFMSYDIEQAKRWLDEYENTRFDLTPGGEQLLNMAKKWDEWHEFFVKYQDRIIYGTDYYPFPKDENWETCFNRRPKFLRQFFETDTEHDYGNEHFKGVKLEEDIRSKIYGLNAKRELGTPSPINYAYMKAEAERLLADPVKSSELDEEDLQYILKTI